MQTNTFFVHLECHECGAKHAPDTLHTISPCCSRPLLARYEMQVLRKEDLSTAPRSMWRYGKMMPVFDSANIVSLGEGFTPMLPLPRLSAQHGFANLVMKDESFNPTGSFKARGMSAAISKAKELGATHCITPTAGNAGGAMAAYCASAGIKATVVMPSHTPKVFKDECELYGAELVLVDGLINDCGKKVGEMKQHKAYFDVSTIKEPYRLEGKKTMGYEIAEQLNWTLPDVILYPAGGGTGLIGIWKAFQEMIALGWILGDKLPRMYAIQAENCRPLVETWHKRQENCHNYAGKPSLANGLAVPQPFAEKLMIEVLQQSNGFPLAISENDMLDGVKQIAKHEGILIAPEGAALWKALQQLVAQQHIDPSEQILLMNTGNGYKYLENVV